MKANPPGFLSWALFPAKSCSRTAEPSFATVFLIVHKYLLVVFRWRLYSSATMAREYYPVAPEVSLFLMRDNKVFLIRRADTGFQDGTYCLPAGHKEKGEMPLEAMIREAKEEVDIDVASEDLIFVHCMYRIRGDERPSYYFLAKTWKGDVKNQELGHKSDYADWFSLDALPENIMTFHAEAIRQFIDKKPYSEYKEEA